MSIRPSSSNSEKDDGEGFEIDWALVYDFKDIEVSLAIEEYRTLIQDLEDFGLQTEVRHGYGASVLVLIRVPRNLLGNEVYRSRVKDWLYAIIHVRPLGDSSTVIDADTPAEELRSVFHLVTWTKEQGGAGVTAKLGKWERVTASFAPHASAANARLLRRFAGKTILSAEDLDEIRALFGEKVGFYYAFLQCYSLFLIVPSTFGILFWLFSSPYSISLATIICFWAIVFVEYWKKQEIDLSIRWDVKGVGALKVNRVQYTWEKEVTDPTTGQVKKVFPAHKRLMRQLLFLPFAALAGLALGTVLVVTFFIEALVSDVYGSYLKEYWAVQFFPTILLAISLPNITSFLTSLAERLTDHENHRTNDEYELAQVQKVFVLNFITSFLPIILTAYVYVPYGSHLIPYLLRLAPQSWQTAVSASDFKIDASRLQDEVISLSMAAQVMNFGEEFVLPYLKQRFWNIYRKYRGRKQAATMHRRQHSEFTRTLFSDTQHEHSLLARIREESEADPYDVQEDIMEMCVQFGYLTLFGAVYPLVPLGFLLNNWFELRGDFFKLSRESQRPPPIRSDSIGPSVAALEFMTWLGSLSTAALVHMYRGEISQVRLSRLLLTVFVAEQAYLAAKFGIRFIFTKIESEAVRKQEANRYMVRKRYLETFSEEAAGTSRRERAHTYTGGRKPVESPNAVSSGSANLAQQLFEKNEPPSQDIAVNTKREYRSEKAENFWTERQDGVSTADAGVRLIMALKGLHHFTEEVHLTADKPKWT